MALFFAKVTEMKNAGSDFTHETVPCPENKNQNVDFMKSGLLLLLLLFLLLRLFLCLVAAHEELDNPLEDVESSDENKCNNEDCNTRSTGCSDTQTKA